MRDHDRRDADVIAPTDSGLAADEKRADREDGSRDGLSLEERTHREVEAHPYQVTPDALPGIQKAEAAALVWPRWAVYCTYAWIWLCFFILALQSAVGNNVTYRAYADFRAAPQITTAYVLSSVIGGVLKLPIAKTVNLWGRAEGFLVFVVVFQLGVVTLATCRGPDSYAAGYVLYWVGYGALYFIMDIFIADSSGLRNRAFAFAFSTTPFICTAFTGSLVAERLMAVTSWRWAYGLFALINMIVLVPLALVFKLYARRARRLAVFVPRSSGRTGWQSTRHYFYEFDMPGAFLLMAAFVLLLLPFSLAQYGQAQYRSATFIGMLLAGLVLLPVFGLYEQWVAPTQFVRWQLLRNRTVLGACVLAAVLFFSFYAWETYYYYYIQVLYGLSVGMTGYMTQIYNVGSCLWAVVFGLYIRQTRHFKKACLFFGMPLMMLGAGLMVHFRGGPGSPIGFQVMCQLMIAVAGGTLVIGQDMAVMAAADRDGVPMMLALLGLSSSLGGAIGSAATAAVYNNLFLQALRRRLPADAPTPEALLRGGGTMHLTFPSGSPTREAIDYAWAYSQKYLSVMATAVLVLGFPAIAAWKDYDLDRRQNKGQVL